MTVAAAANNSDVKNKNLHHKGSHVAKKAKTALDPDIATGKTELTPLQANKYNLGDYAGSITTVDTPDGASNTINMGVNAGIVYNNAPKKGFSGITTNPHAGPAATYTAASNVGPKTYAGKYLNTTFADTTIL